MDSPTWALLSTVFESILQVFFLCFAGWYMCKSGIMNKKFCQRLNGLNLAFLTPSLIFSKVAFSLSPDRLKEFWIIPILFLIITALSFIGARVTARFFGLSRMQRDFATANAMFMNCQSLPVALMQSLVITVPHLRLNEDDNSEAQFGRALTYFFLFASLSMMLRWSYGVKLLECEPDHSLAAPSNSETLLPLALDSAEVFPKHSISEARRAPSTLMDRLRRIGEFMTPPLVATILAVLVAMISPLQTLLADHAFPLKMAISNAGDCSIPLTLVVLGAYFWDPDAKKDGKILLEMVELSSSSSTESVMLKIPSKSRRLCFSDESKTVIAALLTRMIIVPLLMIPLLYYSTQAGLHTAFEDPVFSVSMILLASSPPGLTLAQVVPKSSGDAFERLISRTVFWAYCILTPPTVILYASLGLWISRRT